MTHWRQRTDGAEINLSRDVVFFAVGALVGAVFMIGIFWP